MGIKKLRKVLSFLDPPIWMGLVCIVQHVFFLAVLAFELAFADPCTSGEFAVFIVIFVFVILETMYFVAY